MRTFLIAFIWRQYFHLVFISLAIYSYNFLKRNLKSISDFNLVYSQGPNLNDLRKQNSRLCVNLTITNLTIFLATFQEKLKISGGSWLLQFLKLKWLVVAHQVNTKELFAFNLILQKSTWCRGLVWHCLCKTRRERGKVGKRKIQPWISGSAGPEKQLKCRPMQKRAQIRAPYTTLQQCN